MPKTSIVNFPKELSDDPNRIDAAEADYLFVDISQLPNAGNGLYSAIDILKDEIIAIYRGEVLTENQVRLRIKNNQNRYFINRTDGRVLDSMNTACFAKYANDVKGSATTVFTNNSKIALDESGNICLIALRKIKSGSEIFCSYGKGYWKEHG